MLVTSQTLRAIAWSAVAFSTVRAQNIIENLSFGHKNEPISPNLRGIPHWFVNGDGGDPEVMSDRVILTPPWPGNRRGALWSEDRFHHNGDWTAELQFRVNGQERGGGNLQLWYTSVSQKDQSPNSLYTAPKFDGLVLVVDQYEGRGGSVRGFLNDGQIDIKAHPEPDTLAFGICNYAYRNLGRFSTIKILQSNGIFEVTVDGNSCFKTDKVKLPEGYHFGITASSAGDPDSFEIHKFAVSTTSSYTREEPNAQKNEPMGQRQPQQGQQQHESQQQQQQQQQKDHTPADIPQMLSDVFAGTIQSQADQFADLHDRIQIMSHRVDAIYNILERFDHENQVRFNDLMNRIMPIDDKSNAMIRNIEKIERSSMEILRDLENKDFKDTLNMVHNAIIDNNNAISQSMPQAMAHIVGKHSPNMITYLFIAVAMQIMVVGAYMVYKNRRKNAPKKYL